MTTKQASIHQSNNKKNALKFTFVVQLTIRA